MKRLTLNQAWTLCLKQWKWIIGQLDAGQTVSLECLKNRWIRQNGYGRDEIGNYCFFCEYSEQHSKDCGTCPGRLVAPRFNCCNPAYFYSRKPYKFYAKLLRMDKKRKKSRKEAKNG